MDTRVDINGYCIKVNLKEYSVHLVCNYELMDAMKSGFWNIEKLCQQVLYLHEQHFGAPLKIPLNSLIIEVLGHAYAYKILLRLRKIADLKLFRKFSLNACNIDCGDSAHDSNRWFWDMMGFLKGLLFLGVRKV
ncbi:hypothetical protein [Niabella hibiscisoli]|uniref:hypothetical protein n=1 Tax=Niabella hibiscisoli TaxID=1825928 RepID=UPI001F0EF792|nr:hypothetical protein [Niabella hibiscisoli]MCH5720468.1 hypothetical protein [Niabella hibiscisoli]